MTPEAGCAGLRTSGSYRSGGACQRPPAFFRDVLGLDSGHTEAGWSVFQLPSGHTDFVEVFGPEHDNASLFPAVVSEGIVVAFAVDDVAAAREELAGAKVELIGE